MGEDWRAGARDVADAANIWRTRRGSVKCRSVYTKFQLRGLSGPVNLILRLIFGYFKGFRDVYFVDVQLTVFADPNFFF